MTNRLTLWLFLTVFSGFSWSQMPSWSWNPYLPVLPEAVVFIRFPNLDFETLRPALMGRYYQVFLGQIPYEWTSRQIEWAITTVSGVPVRVSPNARERGWVYLLVETETDRDILLQFHHQILGELTGFWMLARQDGQILRRSLVIEMPRRDQFREVVFNPLPELQLDPSGNGDVFDTTTGFHALGISAGEFIRILLRRHDLLHIEAERRWEQAVRPPLVRSSPVRFFLEGITAGRIHLDAVLVRLFRTITGQHVVIRDEDPPDPEALQVVVTSRGVHPLLSQRLNVNYAITEEAIRRNRMFLMAAWIANDLYRMFQEILARL